MRPKLSIAQVFPVSKIIKRPFPVSLLRVISHPADIQVNAVIRHVFLHEASVVLKEIILTTLDGYTDQRGRSTDRFRRTDTAMTGVEPTPQ